MPDLKLDTEQPWTPGYYWAQRGNGKPEIVSVQVRTQTGRMKVERFGYDDYFELYFFDKYSLEPIAYL